MHRSIHSLHWLSGGMLALIFLLPFNSYGQALRFPQGVASGDPWPTQVIIWTRALPPEGVSETGGLYQIARDSLFQQLLIENVFRTDSSRDFTVKIDVEDLQPGQTYYYRFGHPDNWSPTGRTRTAIVDDPASLRFAVVSCNNYQHGYFGAYRVIARMDSLQAVLHLGDYIYESLYSTKKKLADRRHQPNRETISLADYRERYAQYRSDPDLRAAHQRHPFILVWDDHESSNNSSKDGAQGHQSATEGPWSDRLSAAAQAYYEWLPIREGGPLYRQFKFGQMADLYMLDTRISGRESQIYDVEDSALYAAERTLLGEAQ
ncbi:MAG: alkaline phosphatase D family protein, partial [Bacteroidota bacterium]